MSNTIELKGVRHRGDGEPNPYITNTPEKNGYSNEGYATDGSSQDDIAVAMEAIEATEEVTAYVSEPLEDDLDPNALQGKIKVISDSIGNFLDEHSKIFWGIFYALLIGLYITYFISAMIYSFGDEASIRLLWLTCVVVFFVIVHLISKYCKAPIQKATQSIKDKFEGKSEKISWIVVGIIWAAVVIFIIVDVVVISKNPYNLVSISGIVVYILLLYMFSYAPERVNWRPVAWGLALQFVMAIFILRWQAGYDAFSWIGDRVTEFLEHSDAGASFIFGTDFTHHFIAFKVLPVIVFFSTAISILYYLGAMQLVIREIAWIMQVTMGTTAAESLNAAGNIFIGLAEAPLLIRPLVQNMTRSELHAVMTGGFATIAGSVLGAYVLFGIPANHLISASVMSAPAALAMSKLFYPETEKSKTTADDVKTMEKTKDRNIIEAASSGASASISLVANIAVNLIAFLAIFNFLNETLRWAGERVGWKRPEIDFTFQVYLWTWSLLFTSFHMFFPFFIMSYLMWPFAFVMGTDFSDCRTMARLIGVKTLLNEFVAYNDLGTMVKNKVLFDDHLAMNGTYSFLGDNIILEPTLLTVNATELIGGVFFSDRSLAIATYALCGFANFGSIGITLGGLTAMAPHRRSDLASVALRAMIAGNVACFMTACIAGLFYQPGL